MPESAGRWSLVRGFLIGAPSPTERLAALARQLLQRHGLLSREAVASEGIDGGFAALYPVLRALEEAGQIRRGYFVAGLSGMQFALPEALERLRAVREPKGEQEVALLAATDPANPYGLSLPWPERPDGRRPARSAGAVVLLLDGALAAWIGSGERQLLTFPGEAAHREEGEVAAAVARALAEEVESGRRRAMYIREVDGLPAPRTPMGGALADAGFVYGPQGYMKRA
jgi:ATP-dependent Lhr-like helicase